MTHVAFEIVPYRRRYFLKAEFFFATAVPNQQTTTH